MNINVDQFTNKMNDNFVLILGVKISNLSYNNTLELIKKWLANRGRMRFVVTPNPEFLVKAQNDLEFKNILNQADLAIPDGSKLIWASKNIIKERVSGTDLMVSLCGVCEKMGLTVGLMGGAEKVADKTAECLLKKYPTLEIKTRREPEGSFEKIDVLFVALGMGKQEKWIFNNREMLKESGVKLAMGVGGAFDYISGRVPRAPKFVRDAGFEWLFRLIRQPWRIKRQLALIKFVRLITRGERGTR